MPSLQSEQDDSHHGGTTRKDAATDATQPRFARQISIKAGLLANAAGGGGGGW